MSTIVFRGKNVPVTVSSAPDASAALDTPLVRDWLSSLDDSLDLQDIEIQSLDRFGGGRVGFVKLKAHVVRNGSAIPGVVVLRGSAVAMLPVLTDSATGDVYTVLTVQPRVPTGRLLHEIPAGMSDGAGNLRGVAIKELEEECGVSVRPEELVDLTELAYEGREKGIYTSGGLLDEYIRLFAWTRTMSHDEIVALEGKLTGEDAHEQIVLKLVKLDDMWKVAPDAKSLSALFLYKQLKAAGKI